MLSSSECREFEHRRIEALFADRELSGVYADCQPSGAGLDVVASEGTLPPAVELALGGERKRVGGNNRTLGKQSGNGGGKLGSVHGSEQ
jgi:hypothetical protein